MKLFIKEFFHQLTGCYSDAVIECKSYDVIQYLKATNYQPSKRFTTRRKANVRN
jgi:hypothetical protein